jgi:TonB family protein
MTLLTTLKKEENYFREAIALSIAFHFLLFHAGDIGLKLPQKHVVEIDITDMGRMGVSAPKRAAAPAPAPAPKPVAPPKEWLKPAPAQKVAPAAVPTKSVAPEPPAAPQPANAEIGIGTGSGSEGQLARLPQLLNLSDLAAIQKRFYPEKAREEGREAVVLLDIHIGPDGHVNDVEVVQSADPDFDAAAIHVAKLLRFSPAYVSSQPVAVKMRQAIQFRLER